MKRRSAPPRPDRDRRRRTSSGLPPSDFQVPGLAGSEEAEDSDPLQTPLHNSVGVNDPRRTRGVVRQHPSRHIPWSRSVQVVASESVMANQSGVQVAVSWLLGLICMVQMAVDTVQDLALSIVLTLPM